MIIQTIYPSENEDLLNNKSSFCFYDQGGKSDTVINYDITKKLNNSLANFFYSKDFVSKDFVEDSIFTPGLLYIDNNFLVFEKPPTYKNIFFKPQLVSQIEQNSESVHYVIPIPWQTYIVSYDSYEDEGVKQYYIKDVYMYFSNHAITSFSDDLYLPPLPNFYSNGLLCRPMISNMDEIKPPKNNAEGIVSQAYEWVWNSGTNVDLTESCLLHTLYLNHNSYENNPDTKYVYESSVKYHIHPYNYLSSYYADSNMILKMLKHWETIDIQDICNYSWPIPTSKDYRHSIKDHLEKHPFTSEYITVSSDDYESECCESCSSFMTDEGEISSEISCDDCRCHEVTTNDYNKYFEDTGFFDSNFCNIHYFINKFNEESETYNITLSDIISTLKSSLSYSP